MVLDQRIKRLEARTRPEGLFSQKRCYACGRTDREIPPDFKGLVVDLMDFRPCSHRINDPGKSELVPNMRPA